MWIVVNRMVPGCANHDDLEYAAQPGYQSSPGFRASGSVYGQRGLRQPVYAGKRTLGLM